MVRGDHLIAHRKGYTHHGVDCGDGTVIHFTGTPLNWRQAKIERWTYDQFAKGRPVIAISGDSPELAVQRAESRLGEGGYNLATNNCEHFARWCVEGEQRSPQVATVGIITTFALVGALCWWVKRDA